MEEEELMNTNKKIITRGPIELGIDREDAHNKTSFGKLVLSTE